ncbi:MAG: UPF0280 family protein [Hyphomicrobiales bacterium]
MSVFSEKPVASQSKDGKRLFLKHGPIELVIEAEGATQDDRKAAYHAAHAAFQTILPQLCGELALLRSAPEPRRALPESVVGKAMHRTILPFAATNFVTPMIAVAGSVADHVLQSMRDAANLTKAYVNNGGDIALYLKGEATFELGICSDIASGVIQKGVTLRADDKVGGVATSGWKGRSHSLGIADAVTVFADNAATADCAATLIANAVDVPTAKQIKRQAAQELSPDSDLGERLVTIGVGPLSGMDIDSALSRGAHVAQRYLESGLIASAYLSLQGRHRIVSLDKAIAPKILTEFGMHQTRHGETHA